MQQPPFPKATSTPTQTQPNNNNNKNPTKKKLPTPLELIAHYETQGLDTKEASIKVIEDLQNVLFRVISSNNSKAKKDKVVVVETSKKVDALNNRAAVLDMKVDSKPGFVETFAIGVASGATLKGFEVAWPHVFEGFSQILSAVCSATKPHSSS